MTPSFCIFTAQPNEMALYGCLLARADTTQAIHYLLPEALILSVHLLKPSCVQECKRSNVVRLFLGVHRDNWHTPGIEFVSRYKLELRTQLWVLLSRMRDRDQLW